MGWFSSSPSDSKKTIDGVPQAPGRNERAHCWEARDKFFNCLDQNKIVNAIKDKDLAGERCGKEGVDFEKNCASSWVCLQIEKLIFSTLTSYFS
jgi:cytochrome c oxidase assembly factor 6